MVFGLGASTSTPRGLRSTREKEQNGRCGNRVVVNAVAALSGVAEPAESGHGVHARGFLLARGLRRRAQRDAPSRRPAQI